jgi:hypothetical protein
MSPLSSINHREADGKQSYALPPDFFLAWTLKMEATCSSETLVDFSADYTSLQDCASSCGLLWDAPSSSAVQRRMVG